jgi:flagellar biosynthesis/type III secretory pathway chaperone
MAAAASSPDLQPLVTILSREQAIYQQLLEVAAEERQAIVDRKLVKLKQVLQRQQDVLAKLAAQEDRRVAWLRRYARKHRLEIDTVTLASIIEASRPEDQGLLVRLHRGLQGRVARLTEVNRVTGALLGKVLSSIDQSLHYLLMDDGAGPTYGARGRLQSASAGRQLLEARA